MHTLPIRPTMWAKHQTRQNQKGVKSKKAWNWMIIITTIANEISVQENSRTFSCTGPFRKRAPWEQYRSSLLTWCEMISWTLRAGLCAGHRRAVLVPLAPLTRLAELGLHLQLVVSELNIIVMLIRWTLFWCFRTQCDRQPAEFFSKQNQKKRWLFFQVNFRKFRIPNGIWDRRVSSTFEEQKTSWRNGAFRER